MSDPTTPRLPEKLEPSTPLPWRISRLHDAIVGPRGNPSRHYMDALGYYGGVLVAESVKPGDRDYILRACNAHPAYARAAEALRELIEVIDARTDAFENGRFGVLPQVMRRTTEAEQKARDALAALKEVE